MDNEFEKVVKEQFEKLRRKLGHFNNKRSYRWLKDLNLEKLNQIYEETANISKCGVWRITGIRIGRLIEDLIVDIHTMADRGDSYNRIAAYVSHFIINNQPFLECNKSTAFTLADVILGMFSKKLSVSREEGIKFLTEYHSIDEIERWLVKNQISLSAR